MTCSSTTTNSSKQPTMSKCTDQIDQQQARDGESVGCMQQTLTQMPLLVQKGQKRQMTDPLSRSLISMRGIQEPFLTVILISHFEVVQVGLIPRRHRQYAHMSIMDTKVSDISEALWGYSARVFELLTEIQGEVSEEERIFSLRDHPRATELHKQLCLMAKATKFGNCIFGWTHSSLLQRNQHNHSDSCFGHTSKDHGHSHPRCVPGAFETINVIYLTQFCCPSSDDDSDEDSEAEESGE